MQVPKPGAPMFKDKEALREACRQLGLEIVEKNTYRWYNRSVGDYPLPAGMKASEVGKNAAFVLRLAEPKRSAARAQHGEEPYEIGIVEDSANPGCYLPVYDFYCGGFGLDEAVGAPVLTGGYGSPVKTLCPILKQRYDMVCDAMAAAEVGDKIDFLTVQDAKQKGLLQGQPAAGDADTWCSFVSTEQRIGVS